MSSDYSSGASSVDLVYERDSRAIHGFQKMCIQESYVFCEDGDIYCYFCFNLETMGDEEVDLRSYRFISAHYFIEDEDYNRHLKKYCSKCKCLLYLQFSRNTCMVCCGKSEKTRIFIKKEKSGKNISYAYVLVLYSYHDQQIK